MLFFKSADIELMNAPSHWHLALSEDLPSFAHEYRYSYPALLCLGTFTDVLDFFQDKTGLNHEPPETDVGGALVGNRSPSHQRLMEIALRGGVFWFAAALLSIPLFVVRSSIDVLKRRSRDALFYIVVNRRRFFGRKENLVEKSLGVRVPSSASIGPLNGR